VRAPLTHLTEYNVLHPSEDNTLSHSSIPFAGSAVKAVAISSQLRRYLSAMNVWFWMGYKKYATVSEHHDVL